jgi:two-component system response regulator AtoC
MIKVLLIDDEPDILKDCGEIIQQFGYKCIIANDSDIGIELLKKERPDIVITDQKMKKGTGFHVLEAVNEVDPYVPVIIFTGYGRIELAVEAMKKGAYDYLQKPVMPELLEVLLHKSYEFSKLRRENFLLKSQINQDISLENVIANSILMKDLIKRMLKVAKSDTNVMIIGESGTGKELIARSIHQHSHRKEGSFIPIDCVSLPATLLESELFGFEKGAFTDAVKSKPGMFELANSGTLFLDEITEMEISLQAKLLRVLQERQLRRIGGRELLDIDVRIISATNRNPEEAIESGKIREDLYYRLNVVPIYIPPLRQRKEDIPLLIQHFFKKYNPFARIEVEEISKEAMQVLIHYNWPGNVRELENIIQRIISLADSPKIDVDALPQELVMASNEFDYEEIDIDMEYKTAKEKYLAQFEKKYVKKLLEKYNGNIRQAAKMAGISRQTLYRIMGSNQ